MASTSTSAHDAARDQCKHYVESYDDIPTSRTRPRESMFRQTPPPLLSQVEVTRYNDNYSTLVETLNAQPNGKRSQGDKKSRARNTLWRLWSQSRTRSVTAGSSSTNNGSSSGDAAELTASSEDAANNHEEVATAALSEEAATNHQEAPSVTPQAAPSLALQSTQSPATQSAPPPPNRAPPGSRRMRKIQRRQQLARQDRLN